jgi:DinB superfamily
MSRGASLATWRRNAVKRLRDVRQSTLALISKLPEPEMLRPRTQDRWSVKDVLAHLLSCDEETVRRLRLIERGRGDRIAWFESMADADRFNARTVGRLRSVGLKTIIRRMEASRTELIDRLERLPLASLRDPSHAYTVVDWLPTPGWTHERDHMSEVKAWWREQRPARQAGRAPRRAKR